jgi:thiamine kinase-like enzyme
LTHAELHRQIVGGVCHFPKTVAVAFTFASNIAAWFAAIDLGAVVSVITVGGGAALSLYILAIGKINEAKIKAEQLLTDARVVAEAKLSEAKIKAAKDWEAANKDSIAEDLKKLRQTNHEIKELANTAALNHAIEVRRQAAENERLTRQLEAMTRQLQETNDQLAELKAEYRAVAGRSATFPAITDESASPHQ